MSPTVFMRSLLLFAFFLSLGGVASAASTAPFGFWKFEEGTGVTVANSGTASTISGILTNIANPATGTSGWTSSSAKGKGIMFDGTNDSINLGSAAEMDDLFVKDLTFSVWIKPTNCNSVKYLAGKNAGGAAGFYLFSSAGSCNPRLDVYHSGTRATYIAAANSVSPNTWNYLTVTWNATSKTAKIYVNGIEVNYSVQVPGSGTYTSDALANFALANLASASLV